MASIDLAGLLKSMTAERTQKYQEGLGSLQELLALLNPQRISGAERFALAGVGQSAVSRGLSNTTIPIAQAAGVRSEFEDIRKSRLADAWDAYSQYVQGGTPTAGDVGMLATSAEKNLLAEKEMKATQSITSGGGGGGSPAARSTSRVWRPAQRLGKGPRL